jgi:hypothetical protein
MNFLLKTLFFCQIQILIAQLKADLRKSKQLNEDLESSHIRLQKEMEELKIQLDCEKQKHLAASNELNRFSEMITHSSLSTSTTSKVLLFKISCCSFSKFSFLFCELVFSTQQFNSSPSQLSPSSETKKRKKFNRAKEKEDINLIEFEQQLINELEEGEIPQTHKKRKLSSNRKENSFQEVNTSKTQFDQMIVFELGTQDNQNSLTQKIQQIHDHASEQKTESNLIFHTFTHTNSICSSFSVDFLLLLLLL